MNKTDFKIPVTSKITKVHKSREISGSDYKAKTRHISHKHKEIVETFMAKFKEMAEVFKKGQDAVENNIIKTEKVSSHQWPYDTFNYCGKICFNFAKRLNHMKEKLQSVRKKVSECPAERRDSIRNKEYMDLAAEFGLVNEKGMVRKSSDIKRIKIFPNEVANFILRMNDRIASWVGVPHDIRGYMQVNYAPMQVAKSKEKILMFVFGPVILHLLTDGESHMSKIILLNQCSHEAQMVPDLQGVLDMFRDVEIEIVDQDPASWLMHTQRELETFVQSEIGADAHDGEDVADLTDILTTKVIRRHQGQSFREHLPQLVNLCKDKNVIFTLIDDESQHSHNANGIMDTMIEEMEGALEKVRDSHHLCRQYWTATPAQHFGTAAIMSLGVVGENHTGLHFINGKYVKSISGKYMNDPDVISKQPLLQTIDNIQHKCEFISGSYLAQAYANERRFNRKKKYLKDLGVEASVLVSHEAYKDYCHRMWAAIIHYAQQNNPKDRSLPDYVSSVDGRPWIALRLTKSNADARSMIAGITLYLPEADQYVLAAYNMNTKKETELLNHGKKFDLFGHCQKIMAGQENKALCLFFTGSGRCGDRFPADFRTFIEVPGTSNWNITVILQSFYGRSNGYNKGVPWVILPNQHAQMINSYIANRGIIPHDLDATGASAKIGATRQFLIADYPYLAPVFKEMEVDLDSRIPGYMKIKKLIDAPKKARREISSKLVKKAINLLEKTEQIALCHVEQKDFAYVMPKVRVPRNHFYDDAGGLIQVCPRGFRNVPGNPEQAEEAGGGVPGIAIKTAGRSATTTGQTMTTDYHPTLLLQPIDRTGKPLCRLVAKANPRLVAGQQLIGISLLKRGQFRTLSDGTHEALSIHVANDECLFKKNDTVQDTDVAEGEDE